MCPMSEQCYVQPELDFYKTITLINYIRLKTSRLTCFACDATVASLDKLADHMKANGCFEKIPTADNPMWKNPQ